MPTPRDVFRGRPPTVLTARPVNPHIHRPAAAAPVEDAEPTPSAGTPFTVRWTAAVLAADLHPNAERLAIVLADRADPRTGRIRDEDQLGARALASLAGLTDIQVKTSLEKLRRRGFIRRDQVPRGQTSQIRLLIPGATTEPR